jgi:hypothetical protein
MVFDFMSEDQILTNCLQTIAEQTRVIEQLLASQKKLSEALEISTRELKKLKEKSKQDSDRSIS